MAKKEDIPRNVAGIVLGILGIAMLVYDSTQDWDTIWATAAGIKFILVAVIFLLWGPLKRLDARAEPSAEQSKKNAAGNE